MTELLRCMREHDCEKVIRVDADVDVDIDVDILMFDANVAVYVLC